MRAIELFFKGFFGGKKDGETIRMSDVRFGESRDSKDAKPVDWSYLFSQIITSDENKMQRALGLNAT